MLFKFLLLGNPRLRITLYAQSEAQARQRITFSSRAVCYARINERNLGGLANA